MGYWAADKISVWALSPWPHTPGHGDLICPQDQIPLFAVYPGVRHIHHTLKPQNTALQPGGTHRQKSFPGPQKKLTVGGMVLAVILDSEYGAASETLVRNVQEIYPDISGAGLPSPPHPPLESKSPPALPSADQGCTPPAPGSVIWDTHSPAAVELQILYMELDTILREAYGDTASREFLILRCRERGISPWEATKAVLKGIFTPAETDVTGQRFNAGELNYVVLERTGPGEYMVQCETPGRVGNQYSGTLVPVEYIPIHLPFRLYLPENTMHRKGHMDSALAGESKFKVIHLLYPVIHKQSLRDPPFQLRADIGHGLPEQI